MKLLGEMFMLLTRLKRLIIDTLENLLFYRIEAPKQAKIDDIRVLHYSPNYLIVDKRYDVLINSNDMQQVNSSLPIKGPKGIFFFFFFTLGRLL